MRQPPRCSPTEKNCCSGPVITRTETSDAEHKLVDAYRDLKPIPYQPPWAVLPWPRPSLERPVIKQVVRPPDITITGRIFDLFV